MKKLLIFVFILFQSIMTYKYLNAQNRTIIIVELNDHLFLQDIKNKNITKNNIKKLSKKNKPLVSALEGISYDFEIVKTAPNYRRGDVNRVNKRTGRPVKVNDLSLSLKLIFNQNIPTAEAKSIVRLLAQVSQVKKAFLHDDDLLINSFNEPTDPFYADPYTLGLFSYDYYSNHLRLSGFDQVWRFTTGEGILVGISDRFGNSSSPIHQDLESVSNGGTVLNNYNNRLSGNYFNGTNDNNHGVKVASMVAASPNGLGMVGAAYGSRIIPIQGSPELNDILAMPSDSLPDVINMSWVNSSDLSWTIENLLTQGVVLVAAAGNASDGWFTIPRNAAPMHYNFGAVGQVICVGATEYQIAGSFNGSTFSFSKSDNQPEFRWDGDSRYYSSLENAPNPNSQTWNYSTGSNPETDPDNAFIDISAPGTSTIMPAENSTNGYSVGYGTSFSAPVVSAAVALMLSVNPELTPPEVYEILTRTAVRNTLSLKSGVAVHNHSDGERVWDPYYGYGRLDALEAVLEAMPVLPSQITGSTTLDRPYYRVSESTTIQYGATVNVAPGTCFIFEDNTRILVKNGGHINVNGTQSNPVRFLNAREGEQFYGLSLQSGQNTINWAVFDGGYKSIEIASTNNTINNCTFKNGWRNVSSANNLAGSGNSQATFNKCIFEDATSVGVVAYYSDMSFNDCEIRGSAQAGIWVSSSNVNPSKNLLIQDNGQVQTYRDGIELMSGSFYLYGSGSGQGNNKIQNNKGDQIYVSSGSMHIGEKVLVGYETCGGGFCIPLVPIYSEYGGYNTIKTNNSNRLVTNYSSNFIMAHNNYWGGTPSSSKFYGSIDYQNFLYWDPAWQAGPSSSEVPQKTRQNTVEEETPEDKIVTLINAFDFYLENIDLVTSDNIRGLMSAVMFFDPTQEKVLYREAKEFVNRLNGISKREFSEQSNDLESLKDELEIDLLRREAKYQEMANKIVEKRNANPQSFSKSMKRRTQYLDALIYLGRDEEAISLIADLKNEMMEKGISEQKINRHFDIPLSFIEERKLQDGIEVMSKASITDTEKEEEIHEVSVIASPNPFNPSTNISFNLGKTDHVRLSVHDLLGRQVANLVDGTLNAGTHIKTFNAMNLATGIYVYRLQIGASNIFTGKLTLIK